MQLIDLTLKELQIRATEAGMPEAVANSFTTKAQVVAVIEALELKKPAQLVDPATSATETPKEKVNTDKAWLGKRDAMGRKLELQPKVGMAIQLEPGEKEGIVESKVVNGIREFRVISGSVKEKIINGYKWIMPKGVMTLVPEQVYELISNELNIMAKISSKQSIDRIDPLTGKTVRDALS